MHNIQSTLVSNLDQIYERGDNIAFKYLQNSVWKPVTWKEHLDVSRKLLSCWLNLGLQPGDKIAIVSNTRYEWTAIDLAALTGGMIVVPIYQSGRQEDLSYILNDSEAKLLYLENLKQFIKWDRIKSDCPSIKHVAILDDHSRLSGTTFNQQVNETSSPMSIADFVSLGASTKSSSLATIVYTSGTTGSPKGVLISHEQILHEVQNTYGLLDINYKDIGLTFLPYAHVLGRIESWGHLLLGYQLCFASSIEQLPENLKDIRPTLLMSVPRIYEKIYTSFGAHFNRSNALSTLFRKAKNAAINNSFKLHGPQKKLSKKERIEILFFKATLFKLVQRVFGGRLRFAIAGGAPFDEELNRFFIGSGVLILEGYGMTETCGALSFNRPGHTRIGTVGKPLPGLSIKLAEDGELLVSGPSIMLGYHNLREQTDSVFTGNFLKTGDIATIDAEGFIRITDRKKDLIKTSGGKYVAPQKLESLVKSIEGTSNTLIHGDRKNYIVALITVDWNLLSDLTKSHLSPQSLKDPVLLAKIRSYFDKQIKQINKQLASYETIKKFEVLANDFTVESGELTPSLKVKRKYCDDKFASIIAQLY